MMSTVAASPLTLVEGTAVARRPTDGRGGAGGHNDVLSLPTPPPQDDGSGPVTTFGGVVVVVVFAVVFAVLAVVLRAVDVSNIVRRCETKVSTGS